MISDVLWVVFRLVIGAALLMAVIAVVAPDQFSSAGRLIVAPSQKASTDGEIRDAIGSQFQLPKSLFETDRVRPPATLAATSAPSDFPMYDVDGSCAANYHSNMSQRICIAEEQKYYRLAKMLWDELLPDQKRNCSRLFREAKVRNFTVLGGCVQTYVPMNSVEEERQRATHFRP